MKLVERQECDQRGHGLAPFGQVQPLAQARRRAGSARSAGLGLKFVDRR